MRRNAKAEVLREVILRMIRARTREKMGSTAEIVLSFDEIHAQRGLRVTTHFPWPGNIRDWLDDEAHTLYNALPPGWDFGSIPDRTGIRVRVIHREGE